MKVIRALVPVGVVAVFGLIPVAQAQQVLFERYEMASPTGSLTALCVAIAPTPKMTAAPAQPSCMCYYAIAGGEKVRDDTEGGGKLFAPKRSPDTGFANWLAKGLGPESSECSVPDLLANDLPLPETLRATCRGAFARTVHLPEADPVHFVDLVHGEVEKRLHDVAMTTTASTTATSTTGTTGAGSSKAGTARGSTGGSGLHGALLSAPSNAKWVFVPSLFVLSVLMALAVLGIGALVAERIAKYRRRWNYLKSHLPQYQSSHPGEVVPFDMDVDLETAALRLLEERKVLLESSRALAEGAASAEILLRKLDALLPAGPSDDEANRLARVESFIARVRSLTGAQTGDLWNALGRTAAKLAEWQRIEECVGNSAERGAEEGYVKNAVQLTKRLKTDFWDNAEPETALIAISEFEDKVNTLHNTYGGSSASFASGRQILTSLSDEFTRRESEFEQQKQRNVEALSVFAAVKRCTLSGETALAAVERLIRDLTAAQNFLSNELHAEQENLSASLSDIKARLLRAKREAVNAGCGGGGTIDEMIENLASTIQQERLACKATGQLAALLRSYLELSEKEPAQLIEVASYELKNPHRVLRLCLVAAIPQLEQVVESLAGADAAPLISTLGREYLLVHLKVFVARLETYRGEMLWTMGLDSGFSQQWLHRLFRAEALLAAYYADARFHRLTDIVSIVAGCFRLATQLSGYDVDRIQLLKQPPPGSDTVVIPAPEIVSAPRIRARVQETLAALQADRFVVDVEAFGIRRGNEVVSSSRLVLANWVEWSGGTP